MRPYIIAKAVQGLLCATIMGILWMVMGASFLLPDEETVMDTVITIGTSFKDWTVPAMLSNAGFILGWLVSLCRRWRKNEM